MPASTVSVDIDRLEDALWQKNDAEAETELTAVAHRSDAGPADRLRARLVLSRWHAMRGEYATALSLLDQADTTSWSLEWEVASIAADCSSRIGRPRAALSWLAPLVHRRAADASTLVRVGSARAQIGVPAGHGSGPFFEALNRIYMRDGFAQVRREDVTAPADLSNVIGATPRYEPVESVPRVVVVVHAGSGADSLDLALRSLTAQSWPELDVLVAGDTENPAIQESAARWGAPEHRIRLTATALDLNEADGEYVLVHRADEWSHPQRIELLATRLSSVPSSIAVGTHALEIGRDHLPRWPNPRSAASLLAPNWLSIMIRRSALEELGGALKSPDDLVLRVERTFGPDAVEWLEPDTPLSILVDDPVDPDRPLAARTTPPFPDLRG